MPPELQALLDTHATQLQALLPPHLWPLAPREVTHHGPLTKYVLGEDQPGIWAMLHRLTAADDGPPHSHPVNFHAYILAGGYVERIYEGGTWQDVARLPGRDHLIAAECIHRIIELPAGESWSLCFAGPVVQEWRHYPELLAPTTR